MSDTVPGQMRENRRTIVKGLGVVAASLLAPAAGAVPSSADDRLRRLLDTMLDERLAASPETASTLGLDRGPNAALRGRLSDYSDAGRLHRLRLLTRQLAAIKRFAGEALSADARIDREVVQFQLELDVSGLRRFAYGDIDRYYLPYVVSQLSGAYQSIPDLLRNDHPIDGPADAEAYLSRLRGFAVALDQNSERQREDAGRGVVPPDFVLDLTIVQLRKLRDTPIERSELVTTLDTRCRALGLPGRYVDAARGIIAGAIGPALDRQLAQCTQLRERAPADSGAWSLPDGEAYYAGALRYATTVATAPLEAHRLGLAQIAELSARMETELAAQGITGGTIADRARALGKDPAQLFDNDDAGRAKLIAYCRGLLDRIDGLMPTVFDDLPNLQLEVRRVPPRIEDGSTNGYYESGPLDRSRPAAYNINLRDTHDWPKFTLPTLTYHEGVPGHHLQIGYALATPTIPLIRRRMPYAGFTEGWALYAERLADELGAYDGDRPGRIGYLQAMLYRAARLVVDTGIHAQRWSRAQAVAYMQDNTGLAAALVEREVKRYFVWPGQACAYTIGQLSWLRYRDEARRTKGAAFDLKAFHAVLKKGPMPLEILESVVRAA